MTTDATYHYPAGTGRHPRSQCDPGACGMQPYIPAPAAPPARPLLLLAADPATGTILAAWQADASSSGDLVDRVAAGRGPAAHDIDAVDPDRYQIRDTRAAAGSGFWDAIASGEIGHARLGIWVPVGQGDDLDIRVPLDERLRQAARRALTVQAGAVGRGQNLIFRGTPDGTVAIATAAGELVGRLVSTGMRHAPDGGFGWGYPGSGAAALARSMLTAVLGAAAACPSCNGTGTAGGGGGCDRCDDGIRPLPYQQFKDQVLMHLDPDAGWTIPFAEVLAWLRGYPDPRTAALAAQAGQ